MHLVWKQVLHWAAVLVAMHLMFVADVARMMNSDASALAVLTLLALGTHGRCAHRLVAHLPRRREFLRSAFPASPGSNSPRFCCSWPRWS